MCALVGTNKGLDILSVFGHVSVALATQHAMRMELYCHLWAVRLYHVFPHFIINGKIFEGGGICYHKMPDLIFCTIFVGNTRIYHSKKNSAIRGLLEKYPTVFFYANT